MKDVAVISSFRSLQLSHFTSSASQTAAAYVGRNPIVLHGWTLGLNLPRMYTSGIP